VRTIIFWLRLPLRLFGHFFRFVFGHPVSSVAILTALVALFAYMSMIQIAPDVQAAPTGNAQRIIMMFPAAGAWAAFCAMLVGILLIWMGEHLNKPITTWTEAPSIWAKPTEDTAS
jgi:hypothetical protein